MLAELQTTAATTAASGSAPSTADSYVGTERVNAARAAVAAAEAEAETPSTLRSEASTSVSGGGRLLDLERQWKARMAAAEVRGQSDEELDANCQALVPIEMEIANAPCDSKAAFMAKLRTVVRQGAVYGQLTDIDNAALIDGMIAFMEARFGGDQAVALAS